MHGGHACGAVQDAVARTCGAARLAECTAARRNAAGSVQSSTQLTQELVASAESALRIHAMRGFAGSLASDSKGECVRSMHVEQASSETREESGLGAGFSTSVPRRSESVKETRGACGEDWGVDGGSDVALMTSGAGHDAMAMAQITPVAMLFVRCRAGLSHSPEEFVAPEDIIAAARVLLELVMRDSGIS